jgi:hypothetical protein
MASGELSDEALTAALRRPRHQGGQRAGGLGPKFKVIRRLMMAGRF